MKVKKNLFPPIPEWIAINGMSYVMRVYDYVSRQTVVAVVLCQQVSWSDNEFLLCNCIIDKKNYCYYHDSLY